MEAKVRGDRDPRELDIEDNPDQMDIEDFTKHFGGGEDEEKDPRVL